MNSSARPPSSQPADDDARDAELARVLEELSQEARRPGGTADLETRLRQHPELADELRQLWATMQLAENFGSLCRDSVAESARPGKQILAASADATGHGEGSAAGPSGSTPSGSGLIGPGAVIGDCELLEEIGRGGMGVVFRARQQSLNRIVALKMINSPELASDVDLARFQAEAEAAGRLSHPGIVPVYQVGKDGHRPYFLMKYIEGTTLAQRLATGPLAQREAAKLLLPVCRAIAAAHRQGLLHRDLKPSNILLDREGRPFVTDFGLVRRVPAAASGTPPGEESTASLPALRTLTHSGAIVGTPGYMAPEQAAGQRGETGFATDVYGLGALLYALLTGRAPFQAASPLDTVMQVLEQDPLPPRLLNQSVEADIEMITLKCLQKPPDLRYATADALADDLEAWLAHEPIQARSSQFSQVLSRFFRETHHAGLLENWGLLWMLHSLVLIVLCGTTNLLQLLHPETSTGLAPRLPYIGLWTVGLGIWAGVFWGLRKRSGPITFVERQVAHVWAGSMICSSLLFGVEMLLGLPVLSLSPVLGLISGMVFLVKAGILSGAFYVQSLVLFATGLVMAVLPSTGLPDVGISLFGLVSAACFFVPGLKYWRQRNAAREDSRPVITTEEPS